MKSIAILAFTLLLAPALLRAQAVSGSSAIASPSDSPAASPAPPLITARNVTVLPAAQLIGLLPDPPAGWTSDKPEGATSNSTGFPITTVGCVYVKGNADNAPTATINIIDSANNQQYQDAARAMWGAVSNSPVGYDKQVTVDGLPGFEHYLNTDQTGALWVIAGGRYFVQVETTRLPPSELEAWLSRIDLKKLSALK